MKETEKVIIICGYSHTYLHGGFDPVWETLIRNTGNHEEDFSLSQRYI